MRKFVLLLTLVTAVTLAGVVSRSPETAVAADPPILLRVTPDFAVAGTPGSYLLAATGANLSTSTKVLVNGADAGGIPISNVRMVFTLTNAQLTNPGTLQIKLKDSDSNLESAVIDFDVVAGTNPVPFATAVVPATVPVNSIVTMAVLGTNFGYGSFAYIDGNAVISSTQSETRMLAVFNAPSTPGLHTIRIDNAAPGGGSSNTLSFMVVAAATPPKPVVSSPAPSSIKAGTPGLLLAITVSDLVAGATVELNDLPLSTLEVTQIALTTLLVQVPAARVASVGNLKVVVKNPGGVSGVSDPLNIPIVATDPGPPAIFALQPSSASAGGSGFALVVGTANIGPNAYVAWNGTPLSSAPFSSGAMVASVPAEFIAAEGTAAITVVNPLPGGGTSASSTFTIGPGAPPPNIVSAPATIDRQATPFLLTITGTGLTIQSVLDFGGMLLPALNAGAGSATYGIPPSLIQELRQLPLTVRIPGGADSNTVQLNVKSRADVDCSGASIPDPDGVDATDALVEMQIIAGLATATCGANADGIGDVNLADVIYIRRIVAELQSAP